MFIQKKSKLKLERKENKMSIPRIQEDFSPDFNRKNKYDRKYFNTPFDIVYGDAFKDLPYSAQALYQQLAILSFMKANSNGWFPISMKNLCKFTKMSINTLREAKAELLKKKFIDVGRAYNKDTNIHYADCYRINGFKEIVE